MEENIKIIKNKKEYEKFYYYKGCKIDEYPKNYPCIAEIIYEDGGLGGSYVRHVFIYLDKVCNHESFLQGYIAARKQN